MKAEVIILLTLAFLCAVIVYSDACSCMPTHPQQHYCRSSFVILARVKRERVHKDMKIYKVRVRKQFKITEKAEVALKSGRLLTPVYDAACGIQLQPGKLYVLSGTVHSLKAHISLCDMAMEWHTLTRRQRKGLKLLYKHGCTCEVKKCWGRCPRQKDVCSWNSHCQTTEGICLRQANKSCMWTRNKALAKCMNGGVELAPSSKKYDSALLYNLP